MTITAGRQLRCGIAKGTTWGTIVDPTVLYPLTGETVVASRSRMTNNELGAQGPQQGEPGPESVTGSLTRYLHYQGDLLPLALGMGTAGTPTQVGASGDWDHTIAIGALDGIFGSLALDKDQSQYEVDSFKVDQITIEGQSDGYMTVSYDIIGRDMDIAGDAAFGSMSENANSTLNFVPFGEGTFRIAAQGSDPSQAYNINQFSLTIARGLAVKNPSQANWPNIDEPGHGFREITFSVTFGTYQTGSAEAHGELSNILDHTLRTGAFEFDGPTGDSNAQQFYINLPMFFWEGDLPSLDGPDVTEVTLNGRCEVAASNPTGMDDTDVHFNVRNQESSDPLA